MHRSDGMTKSTTILLLLFVTSLFPCSHALSQVLWTYELNSPSYGGGACADIDRDGCPEIVFGTYFGDQHLYALNAESGSLLWSFYQSSGPWDASLVIADVNQDSELEVVSGHSGWGGLFCLDGATGDKIWNYRLSTGSGTDSPPAVADVDNDGKPEIVFGAFFGWVYVINGEDGSHAYSVQLVPDGHVQTDPAILDVDNDQKLDIVVASYDYNGDNGIYALRGEDLSQLWYTPTFNMIYHGGSFADIDGDDSLEIAFGCFDGYVYVLNVEDGSMAWQKPLGGQILSPVTIADLNDDGTNELIAATRNLYALSNTGSILWQHNTGGTIWRGGTISDMDGDGILDVIFGSDDGMLRVLRGNDGHVLATFDATYPVDHHPIIADLDQDDKLDIFFVCGEEPYGEAFALSGGYASGRGWKMFKHDFRHSGCFHTEDMHVEITNAPSTVFPGEQVSLTYRLSNPVPTVQIYDVWLGVRSSRSRIFQLRRNEQIIPQGNGEITVTITAPSKTPSGKYTALLCIGDFPTRSIWSRERFSFTVEQR
jgi:outer membrane protein assembly factor BamB